MIELPLPPSRLNPTGNGHMMPSPTGGYVSYEQYNLLRFKATLLLDDNTKLFKSYKAAMQNTSTANSLFDTLSARCNELVKTLREYLNYSSIDGCAARHELRAKLLRSIIPDTPKTELALGDTVYIAKFNSTANAFAEVRQLDDLFVWVSNTHWATGAGDLTLKKLFKTEVAKT